MSYLLKGALPFALALATGLLMAAALGHWQSREWRHQARVYALNAPMNDGWRRGCRRSFGSVRTYSDGDNYGTWTRIESDRSGTLVSGSVPVRVISYSILGAVDGQPVTRDAVITNLPTPRSWTSSSSVSDVPLVNNVVLNVTLGPSGRVTEVTVLGNAGVSTQFNSAQSDLSEIMSAAHDIEFQPAMRNGTPVSQQISVSYRQQR